MLHSKLKKAQLSLHSLIRERNLDVVTLDYDFFIHITNVIGVKHLALY